MNLREVVRTLRFERRRVLAMSRVCDPADCCLITPEEYDREYGEDEPC